MRATAFHAVDRGSNPLGDANKRSSSVERAFESKFCAFFFSIAFLFQKPFQPLLSSLEEACYLPPAAYAASRILLPQISFRRTSAACKRLPPCPRRHRLPPASCLAFPSSTDAPPNVPAGHVYASALHQTITPAISKVKKP